MNKTNKYRKILIIRWGALGDLVMCSAIFQDIYEQLPESRLHLMVESKWSPLFINDFRFEEVITTDFHKKSLFSSLKQWLSLLYTEKYDLIIDLQNNDRSHFLIFAAWILGIAPKWRVSTTDNFPYNIKTIKRNLDLNALKILQIPLTALNLFANNLTPKLFFSETQKSKTKSLLLDYGIKKNDYIAIAPGSSASGISKRWGSSNFIELSLLLLNTKKIKKIVILGGPDEAEVCEDISLKVGSECINLSGLTEFSDIPEIINGSKCLVSNDTGIAHMGAIHKKPVFIIYGPTKAERVKPYGRNIFTFQAPSDYYKSNTTIPYISLIKPIDVFNKIDTLI